MKNLGLTILSVAFLLFSCGEQKAEQKSEEKKSVQNCYYEYSAADSKLEWTAFKFLRKAPVGGTFTAISVSGGEKNADVIGLIENLSFAIPVSSVETKNADRNKKIDSLFFGSMQKPEQITGKIMSLKEGGKAIIAITMNEVTREVEGMYTLEDATFTYKTTIDVLDWNASKGLSALNTACKDLHTDVENGDTESKLWSEVEIMFSTTLKKECE